jgi:uncharacterized protein YdeI (YjbR/CyaY-like superfamily)
MESIPLPSNSFHPLSVSEWHQWLKLHSQDSTGVWLISYKKATGKPRIEYDAAVEEALCFGWIDSKPNSLDEERSMLWFAPRKPGTGWSKLNKERVERLIREGRMSPAGLKKIDAAKLDGSWNALDDVERLELPGDLQQAFQENPVARDFFEKFPRSAKRAILEWIASARKTETRASRIEETVRKAAQNIRANQWRQPK